MVTAMSTIRVVTPIEFVFESGFAFIATILNATLFTIEYYKRKSSEKVVFLSKWTKITSALCIIVGTLFTLSSIIAPLKIFCSFGKPLQFLLITAQCVFMGFNQIARLYYCFSQNQVHTKKGYSDYLFLFMVIIGIGIVINMSIFPWVWVDELCGGITVNGKYKYIAPNVRDAPNANIWINFSMLVYILWDFLTLLLYICKVLSFRRFNTERNKEIYLRIMFILKKVVILTVLYEIPCTWCTLSGMVLDKVTESREYDEHPVVIFVAILYQISWQFASVILSLSVFLMQAHNDHEYHMFLKMLYNTRIYYICCGCRDVFEHNESKLEEIVNIEVLGDNKTKNKSKLPSDEENKRKTHTGDTLFETRDISLPHTPIPMAPRETAPTVMITTYSQD